MIKRLKYFHDSLNIPINLAPDREYLSAKYAQFSLTFTQMSRTILFHFTCFCSLLQ